MKKNYTLDVLRDLLPHGSKKNHHGDGHRANRPLHQRTLRLESLEDRTLLSISGIATYYHIITPLKSDNSSSAASLSSTKPAITPATSYPGYIPAQIRTAYGLNSIQGDGTGQIIGVVDAYDDPNIASELAYFDSSFGIAAPPSLTVIKQSGVKYNSGWVTEIALDVEWAHAMAPGASIVLVEATNSSTSNLYQAVATASSYSSGSAKVSVVTMSWGGSETSGDISSNSTYFQVSGVTFLAATGDDGSPGGYPAYSPDVVAVGGTTLTIDSNSYAWVSETGWVDSGGGTSSYESKPNYQTSIPLQTNNRMIPDVSFDANPSTGVSVYIMNKAGTSGTWYGYGGTSVASPCWAGIIADINQLRVNAGLTVLNSSSQYTQTDTLLYSLYASSFYSSCFHDINTPVVSNGSFSTGAGYDEVTGIGSPIANVLVPYMVQSVPTGSPSLVSTYDTGASNSDKLTYYNNSNSSNVLKFTVPGVVVGPLGSTTVTIYADGTAIGSATVSSTSAITVASVTVTTNGSAALADGTHAITIKQTESGKTISAASASLTITIDATPPTVATLTSNLTTVADANVGTSKFWLTITFSEAMNTAVLPTISFPVENPSGTLAFNSTTSGWTTSTVYVARFDVLDANVLLPNIDVQVSGAQDLAGNTQTTKTVANLFNIDMLNPAVTINLASGQASPTSVSPINYTVVFSESVADFISTDVTLSGTAGATTAVVTGNGVTYNVAVSGMTAGGTVTATIMAGTVHDAVGNANTASTSTNNTATYNNLPTVESVAINDGNAQRSKIDSITVTFSQTMTIGSGAFAVTKTDSGGAAVNVAVATSVVGGKTVATLTFSGSLTQYSSLVDGSYLLTIYGNSIYNGAGTYLDGDGNGTAGGNYTDAFFRKFGDANGDGLVNGADLAVFQTTYLKPSNYLWYFDFDGDGDVDNVDAYQLKLQYTT